MCNDIWCGGFRFPYGVKEIHISGTGAADKKKKTKKRLNKPLRDKINNIGERHMSGKSFISLVAFSLAN